MYDFADLAPASSNGLTATLGISTSELDQEAALASSSSPAATNGWIGGTKERIPDDVWASWWDGGTAYNGGGAFNNTLAGIYFEVVTYDDGTATLASSSHAGSPMFEQQGSPPKEPNIVVEGLIITGKRLASEFEIARTLARLTPSMADDVVTTMGALAFGAGPHRYVTLDQVGDSACDADEAWAGLLQFPAPGAGPVTDGQISNLPGFGPIQTTVDAAHMKIVNTALPGHLFYPGTVTREVVVSNGKVYIQTTGTGTGQFAGINTWFSQALWGQQDAQIAAYVDANDNGPDDC